MSFDFSNIDLLPVLAASLTSLVAEIIWVRFYQQKATIPSFLIRLSILCVLACGINLACHHNHLIGNIKQSLYTCLLFAAPSLGLQTLNDKKSFSSWFITTLHTTFHFILLSSIIFGVIKLMS